MSYSMFPGIFVGPLIHEHGGRTVAIFGALISTVGFMVSALVTNMEQLYLTYGFITGKHCRLL
jgi:hypothetical protein